MAALTEDTRRGTIGGVIEYITAAPDTYFNGAFLTIGSDGKAKNAAAATETYLGVYSGNERKLEATDTDQRLRVLIGGYVDIKNAALADTQTNQGKFVQLSNNNDVVAHQGNNKKLGRIVNLNSTDNIVRVNTEDRSD